MKPLFKYLILIVSSLHFLSCSDAFLETPAVTGMSIDNVFSTAKNAEGAIAEAYATILSSGLPVYTWNNTVYMPYEATEGIMGGEDVCAIPWDIVAFSDI